MIDFEWYAGSIKQLIAERLNVADWEWMGSSELSDAIELKNSGIKAELDCFLETYKKWCDFHEDVKQKGIAGNLNPKQTQELIDLVTARDSERATLISHLPPK